MHLASVVIPTYNRPAATIRALESVKSQSHRPTEAVVVDDGSTDDTAVRVEEWMAGIDEEGLSFKLIRKENGGPSSGRNVGISHAEGQYIYFLDSDDRMHRDLLTRAIAALEEHSADCVLFGFDWEGADGRLRQWVPTTEEPLWSLLEGKLWGFNFSSLRTAELIAKSGAWRENSFMGEDYEFLGRSLFNSETAVVLPVPLVQCFQQADSLSLQKESPAGLHGRLVAESSLVKEVNRHRSRVPDEVIAAYADRLTHSALIMAAKGHSDFAREISSLVRELRTAPRTLVGRAKRLTVARGRWACRLWRGTARVVKGIRTVGSRASAH